MTVPCVCLPGPSDINVPFLRTSAAVGLSSPTPGLKRLGQGGEKLVTCQTGDVLQMAVGRDSGIRQHHVHLFLYSPRVFYKTINQETRFG